MKHNIFKNASGLFIAVSLLLSGSCTKDGGSMDLDGETDVLSFALNGIEGEIDLREAVVTVPVAHDCDLSAMTVTALELSEGAEASMETGDVLDLTLPRTLRVTNGDVYMDYSIRTMVRTDPAGAPEFIFAGLAVSVEGLNPEERTAAMWMLSNVENSVYASFGDIASGLVDLSGCKAVWWHYHNDDGNFGSESVFNERAAAAVFAAPVMKSLLDRGTGFVLTRYAVLYAAALGIASDGAVPNNCWGDPETAEYVTSEPWSFTIAEGQAGHPLYAGIDFNDGESDKVYTCDAGYRISNSTAQWFIGDWSSYEDVPAFESRHGATALSVNVNNGETSSVPVWEYPSIGSRGKVVCIGSGCYDWYFPDGDASADRYHGNVAKLTENALNYVSKE